jgi:hypothetical protein
VLLEFFKATSFRYEVDLGTDYNRFYEIKIARMKIFAADGK